MKALHDLLSHHIDDLEDVMAALKDVCDHPYALSGESPNPSPLPVIMHVIVSGHLHEIHNVLREMIQQPKDPATLQ